MGHHIDYVGSWGPAIIGHAHDKVIYILFTLKSRGYFTFDFHCIFCCSQILYPVVVLLLSDSAIDLILSNGHLQFRLERFFSPCVYLFGLEILFHINIFFGMYSL